MPRVGPPTHDEPLLTEDDRAILDFEARWWKDRVAKEDAIVDTFDIRSHRYLERLVAIVQWPEALAYAPTTVRRVQRAMATARAARSARQL